MGRKRVCHLKEMAWNRLDVLGDERTTDGVRWKTEHKGERMYEE